MYYLCDQEWLSLCDTFEVGNIFREVVPRRGASTILRVPCKIREVVNHEKVYGINYGRNVPRDLPAICHVGDRKRYVGDPGIFKVGPHLVDVFG